MKLLEKQKSLEPLLQIHIPESVMALSAVVNFWQPNMDYDYNKASRRPPEMKPKQSAMQTINWLMRKDRGEIWRQDNLKISELGLPNTKANRQAMYFKITQQKAGKME